MPAHVPSGRVLAVAAAATVVATAAAPSGAAAAYVRQGTLTCNVEASRAITQSKAITCSFAPLAGSAENFTGSLRKVGLAVGRIGGGVIVWAVLSAAGLPARGDVAGSYFRATADEANGIGLGPHVLVGGGHRWFALQALSASGGIDLDYAQNITGLVLDPAR